MKKIFTLALLALTATAFVGCSTPTKTIENLQAAATGETNASAKYAAFSARATVDSLPHIAAMFAATSAAEAIHAANHVAELKKLGVEFTPVADAVVVDSTLANLYAAKNGEEYEFSTMYPEFIEVATTEKAQGAVNSFEWATKAEAKHADFYIAAIQALESGAGDLALVAVWNVCPKCGDTYAGDDHGTNCGLCGVSAEQFTIFQ